MSIEESENPRLCTYRKGRPDLIFPLNEDELYIGRSLENAIRLDDEKVSRRHARLFKDEEGWRIEDLGSTNGIQVNGVSVASARLKDGDRIRIGNEELALELRVLDNKWVPTFAFDLSSQHSHKTMFGNPSAGEKPERGPGNP